MNRLTHRLAAGALALALGGQAAASPAAIDIPFEQFTLDNGLTVVVHEDRKAPIVSVNVWYHVGSKDERPGRTGFAHLFEHLMFQGSEHFNDEFFGPFEQVGTTDQNGTTSFDRTNYFQNVPTTALDMALWMESDRMGHLLGVIDQARLDEQRGVVQNEKRQGENQPFGRVWETLFKASFPQGHPYSWMPIGSMEDLNAASLEDVHAWFRTYYGAANATLVLAGDIDAKTAREKAERYFGHIPAGPALTRRGPWIAARTESTRDVMFDRVSQSRLYRAYNIPGVTGDDVTALQFAANILGGSAASRLDRRLVHGERLADSASSFAFSQEIAGLFVIQADVKQGVEFARVERMVAEELTRLIKDGPTREEVERARTALRAGFVRGIERIGGFGGKSDVLAECTVYHGDPGCFRKELAALERITAADVQAAAARWLAQGDYTLEVHPFPTYSHTDASAVDRSTGVPAVDTFPDLRFPALERARLSNGIEVVLARRSEIPVVQVQLLLDAGYAADAGAKPGTASFAMSMLDEGAGKLGALDLKAAAESLGAQVYTGSSLDTSYAGVSALTDQLDPSLGLLADVVLRPRFEDSEIERVRAQWLAGIAREKTQPNAIANRLLPPLLYGDGHAYAIPFTGSGTEDAIRALTRDDLLAFQRAWVRPDNARLLVVGDTTREQILPLLEKHFGGWTAPATPRPAKNVADVPRATGTRVFLVDKPGAPQSIIIGGLVAPSTKAANNLEIETMNSVFGGLFSARLNMNLREAKHWSYGAYSYLPGAVGPRPFMLSAPVQTDKTAEALAEILSELRAYVGDRPATAEEIAKVKNNDVRSLPGQFETASAVLGSMRGNLVYDRPDDYVTTLAQRILAQSDDAVRAAAQAVIAPDAFTWVIVGDLSKIEAGLRAMDLGPVAVLDADGNPVR